MGTVKADWWSVEAAEAWKLLVSFWIVDSLGKWLLNWNAKVGKELTLAIHTWFSLKAKKLFYFLVYYVSK